MLDSTSEVFELSGALRIIPNHDCLGIPVFSRHPLNECFVPETDESLFISKFIDVEIELTGFTNIKIPESVSQYYRVGDPVPIPIWVQGRQDIVPADRDWKHVSNDFQVASPVVTRLRATLKTAQANTKEKPKEDWAELEEFVRRRPTADRHWVGQFRDFLARSNRLDYSGREQSQRQLADLATRWAAECAGKAETKTLRSFIEVLTSLVGSRFDFGEAESFALLRHVLARPSAARSVAREINQVSEALGSSSIVEFLERSGAGRPEFKSSLEQLNRSLRTALLNGRCSQIENYAKLFGESSKLPPQVEEIAHLLASWKSSQLATLADMVLSSESKHGLYARQLYAVEGLEAARLLEAVYRLLYADQRERDLYETSLMGIDRDTLKALEAVAKRKE